MTAPFESLAVGWRLSSVSGWGVYGLNLTLQLLEMGRQPVLYLEPNLLTVDQTTAEKLASILKRQEMLGSVLEKGTVGQLDLEFPVLFALRNDLQPSLTEQPVTGDKNVGVIFFEDTGLSEGALQRAGEYDLIVTGSSWNERILAGQGIKNVTTVFQGIDPALFHYRDHAPKYRDRFVVFSGGKFEYRKSQDLVIAAFREFHSRHADALLTFAWSNQWTQVIPQITASPHLETAPEVGPDGTIEFSPWLIDCGLPESSFIDLGMIPNAQTPEHLAAADVALFPNRCEPGTNLVAMEAMATGVPCILSANTGHLDLIEDENSLVLREQASVAPVTPFTGADGWGESSVDEIVANLETAYQQRERARQIGQTGAKTMERFCWSTQITQLVSVIDGLNVK